MKITVKFVHDHYVCVQITITVTLEVSKYKQHATTVDGAEQVICKAELKAADIV